jgi:hypothetical protein
MNSMIAPVLKKARMKEATIADPESDADEQSDCLQWKNEQSDCETSSAESSAQDLISKPSDETLAPDTSAPGQPPMQPMPGLVAPPQRLPAGLKDVSEALSSRGICMICSHKILKGTFWVSYRVKASRTIADEKRCHAVGCCSQLPLQTRGGDIDRLDQILGDDPEPNLRLAVGSVKDAMQITHGDD